MTYQKLSDLTRPAIPTTHSDRRKKIIVAGIEVTALDEAGI
jgi:hypothetical protein